MPTYYLITIQKLKDGTTPTGIFAYEGDIAATAAYHSTLASCYANDNLTYFCVTVIDEQCNVILTECRYND